MDYIHFTIVTIQCIRFCWWAIQAPQWVWRKKKVFKKAHFFFLKKKVFQYQDYAFEIYQQTQRYSLWSGLVTWSQGFSYRFVFLSILFNKKLLCDTRWHEAMCRAAMCPNTACVEGAAGLSLPQMGIFRKYKLWKGHLGVIFKTPEKKKAKKGFSQKLGKKGFCLRKKS